MPDGPIPGVIFVLAGLIILAAIALATLIAMWWRGRQDPPEDPDPGEPMVVQPLTSSPRSMPLSEAVMRIEDALTRRTGSLAELILESEVRLKGELLDHACKLDILTDAVRQNSKELAVIDQLLRDIVQILNINISESKGVSQKLQKYFDEPKTAGAQRLNQLR